MRQPRLIEPYNRYEFFPTKYNDFVTLCKCSMCSTTTSAECG